MAAMNLRQWTSNITHCRNLLFSYSKQTVSGSNSCLCPRFFNTSLRASSTSAARTNAQTPLVHPSSRLFAFVFDVKSSSSGTPTGPSTVWTRWYRAKNDALAARTRLAALRIGRSRSSRNNTSFGGPNPLANWFNRLPSNFVVWGILGLNGAVYMAWQYAGDQARAGDSSLFVAMYKNVLLSWRNIREGRIWTIITSTFSHSSATHFLFNALTFYFMAPPVVHMLGNTAFLGLYFLGGVSCSVVSLLLNQSLRKRDGASNGASGAIYAVMTFFACVSPNTKFLIFFVLPVPAWAVVSGFLVWDGFSALTDRRTTIDGAGHVGGILAGAAYYLFKARFRL